MPRRPLALVLCLLGLAAAAPAAQATTRYAAPGGATTGDCTLIRSPCTLLRAINQAVDGDTVLVGPGAYGEGALTTSASITIARSGTDGPRPVISSAASTATLGTGLLTTGVTVRGLDVRNTGTGSAIHLSGATGVIEDVVATAAVGTALDVDAARTADVRRSRLEGGLFGAQMLGTASSSVFTATNVSGAGLATPTFGGGILTAVNVTAVDTAGRGVYAYPAGVYPNAGGTIALTNSIAVGGVSGAAAGLGSTFCLPLPCASGAVAASRSIIRPGAFALGPDDLGDDPLFTSATDLHLQRTSPAVDRGIVDPLVGATDVDGNPRIVGSAVDLGAYELQPPAPVTSAGTPVGTGGAGAGDTTPPTLGRLTVAPARFAVGAAPTAVSAARRRTPRGTRIDTATSEAGTLTLVVAQAFAGRRSGTRCLQPRRSLRRAAACTRLVTVGTLTRRVGAAGPVSIAFSGRIGRRPLAAGRYRLSAVAADAAGNRSAPRATSFTVTR